MRERERRKLEKEKKKREELLEGISKTKGIMALN